jgi:hypothetical protein
MLGESKEASELLLLDGIRKASSAGVKADTDQKIKQDPVMSGKNRSL